MTGAAWWQEMAAIADAEGHERWSSGWYASIRDQHAAVWPDADARTRENLAQFVEDARVKEARVLGSDAARAVGRFEPGGPTGYRAASLPGAPVRATRVEAERDEAAHLDPPALFEVTA